MQKAVVENIIAKDLFAILNHLIQKGHEEVYVMIDVDKNILWVAPMTSNPPQANNDKEITKPIKLTKDNLRDFL